MRDVERRNKRRRHIGKKEWEKPSEPVHGRESPLAIVIMREGEAPRRSWLTGFDAPSLHTMYADKPMQGHGLMQAIARVNRVFKDKPGGLIVSVTRSPG